MISATLHGVSEKDSGSQPGKKLGRLALAVKWQAYILTRAELTRDPGFWLTVHKFAWTSDIETMYHPIVDA
jgi:hypothetical protein